MLWRRAWNETEVPGTGALTEEIAVRWRPWRAVAATHLITRGASADTAEFAAN